MQFHYVVAYDTDTKEWRIQDSVDFLPDGNVWMREEGNLLWEVANDEDGTAELNDEIVRELSGILSGKVAIEVAVILDGGIVQEVKDQRGNPFPADVRDYDTEGLDPDELEIDDDGNHYYVYSP